MKPRTASSTKLVLEFDDYKLLPPLFGQHDRNLARIEQKLKVSAACFGNKIELKGNSSSVHKAKAVLEALYRKLESENLVEMIDPGIVDAALEWVQTSTDATRESGLSYLDEKYSGLETWKRKIFPRSPNQQSYIRALLNSELAVGVGPAGTGKTYLAVAVAVSLLKQKKIERLILSRPAVEAGERLGFLPGDMKEKVDPYLRPLYDALYDMMPSTQVERWIENGQIEVAPLAFMRGRTLSNSYVILDEAQNTTPAQMKMFLTRMGENSRVCVTGDLSQIDLPPGTKSGLLDAIEILKTITEVEIIAFSVADIIRHPMVNRIVKAYDKREGNLLYEVPAQ
ncbi:MAG: phosphate starvation-inducible protein PhoH [Rhodospirillaceae bacterium]|nr:phosphate starvation-inducible protein PhoH [Rhodospirillaceae bacterium]